MKVQKEVFDSLKLFLKRIPPVILARARDYHASGRVAAVECMRPNELYIATVHGSKSYLVELEFSDSLWLGYCSCPMEFDCKHIVAATLAIQARIESAFARGEDGSNSRAQARAQQPTDSPLARKLKDNLGRPLLSSETAYIRNLQIAYKAGRHFTEADLRRFANGQSSGHYSEWATLDLWDTYPKDDFYYWLHLAWELRNRQLSYPAFMAGITDFSLIEPQMRRMQRQKQVAQWHRWLNERNMFSPKAQPLTVELRVCLGPKQAQIQWRPNNAAPFADLKHNHAKKLSEQFAKGDLLVDANSAAIWAAVYRPFHYESWWTFNYDEPGKLGALNRVLRLPPNAESLVTSSGEPVNRLPEPLQLELRPGASSEDYELMLLKPDGARVPQIWCVLPGEPAIYITEEGVYTGPACDALQHVGSAVIPSEALETAEGVRFLAATGIALPQKLQDRVTTVPVRVTLKCDLKQRYAGSATEEIIVTVTAHAPGIDSQTFTSEGWRSSEPFRASVKGPNARSGERIIIHDTAALRHFPGLLQGLLAKWEPYPGNWTVRLTKKTPELFAAWLKTLPPGIEVLLDKQLASLRDEPISGSVSLDVTESGMDWFDLKVVLNVGDTTLTPEELKMLLNAQGGYVRVGKNGWRRLQLNISAEEDDQLARLGLNARDFTGEAQRFHALQLADKAAARFLGEERAALVQRRASELKTRVTPPVPSTLRAELRPYQTEGFHFLAYLTSNRFGGVLADDMGLGKTLQTLAWLAWLSETAGAGKPALPSLVICPKSVTDNWRAEAERFYPALRVRVWRGEAAEELRAASENVDVIVLNYAQLRSLSPPIAKLKWFAVILDEAQYIKNPDSQTAQAARNLTADHRLALTGTPIENRLLDLWSIFGFAMPGVLGNRGHFLRRFDAKDDPHARRRLAARVRPFLLRRTKTQVAKDLPDRIEEDLFCEMDGQQSNLYRAEFKKARQILLGLKTAQQFNKERFNILTSLLRLRQICCHPALVAQDAEKAESAKVSALEDLLEPLMEEGHKVLVFSQFVTMLAILREKMVERSWPHFYLAGDTENRGELVRDFESADGAAVFLISLKAGGFGLNLTAASYVILFDPWWNPAVENQAIDRTHRIGQRNKVIAYRLLIRDTIEQKIRQLQKQKAALADDVLGEERFAQSLTIDDLQFLFSE